MLNSRHFENGLDLGFYKTVLKNFFRNANVQTIMKNLRNEVQRSTHLKVGCPCSSPSATGVNHLSHFTAIIVAHAHRFRITNDVQGEQRVITTQNRERRENEQIRGSLLSGLITFVLPNPCWIVPSPEFDGRTCPTVCKQKIINNSVQRSHLRDHPKILLAIHASM